MKKVETACTAAWTAKFDADEAETACDAIEVTRGLFKDAHGIGGLYYVVNPLLGGGPPLVAGAMLSSISSGAGGAISTGTGAVMVPGFGVPSVSLSPPPGEKFKYTSSQTRDKDGLFYNCNKPAVAPGFVIDPSVVGRPIIIDQ